MLALKLLLVPGLLLGVTWAGRRWGAEIAGCLAGLPLIVGPALMVLAIERGSRVASDTASAALGALIAPTAFNLTYARVSQFKSWRWALPSAFAVWSALGGLIVLFPATTTLRTATTFAFLLVVPPLFPRAVDVPRSSRESTRELGTRMLVSALVVAVASTLARNSGPVVGGLALAFPTLASVLGVGAHRADGAHSAGALLRGMVESFQSVAGFCLAVALLLPHYPAVWAFTVAVLVALLLAWYGARSRDCEARQAGEFRAASAHACPMP